MLKTLSYLQEGENRQNMWKDMIKIPEIVIHNKCRSICVRENASKNASNTKLLDEMRRHASDSCKSKSGDEAKVDCEYAKLNDMNVRCYTRTKTSFNQNNDNIVQAMWTFQTIPRNDQPRMQGETFE
jgi:hypothetical protein